MPTSDSNILECGHPPTAGVGGGVGYGTDKDGNRHCYACCAERDKASMIETGKAMLYLVSPAIGRKPWHSASDEENRVTNWPGSLPDAKVRTSMATYLNREHFESTHAGTYYYGGERMGSRMLPYGEACTCAE